MKILLLDDNIETYEVLREVASLSGSEVIYFNDVIEAQKYILEHPDIDAIISEKYINNRSSAEILGLIKKNNMNIPVILLTDELSEDEKDYYKRIGITEFFYKPFNPLELMTSIVEHLKNYKGEEYIKETLHTKEESRESLKAIVKKIINLLKKLFGR